VIGVAKAGWNLEQLKSRAKDSLEKHGSLDAAKHGKLKIIRLVLVSSAEPGSRKVVHAH
jgi:glucose-6-phosphate 1-dehydrogenase